MDNNDDLDVPYFRGGINRIPADPSDGEQYWTWRPLFDYSPEFPFEPKTMMT